MVGQAALRTRGAGRPSGVDANGFRRILACKYFKQSSTRLCEAVVTIGTLSIDDEMGRRRRPEVKFSRANLLGMRKVVKTLSSLRRRRNSGRVAVVAKT